MGRKRKLSCVELRVHLCEGAVKNTDLCRNCKHLCKTGVEYRERFLGVRTQESAENERKRQEILVAMLTRAYMQYMNDGKKRTELVLDFTDYGIRTAADLSAQWNAHMKEMESYCILHDLVFPTFNVMNAMRGYISREAQLEVYRKRKKEYDILLQAGYNKSQMAEYYGISPSAMKKRIQAANDAVKQAQERLEMQGGYND